MNNVGPPNNDKPSPRMDEDQELGYLESVGNAKTIKLGEETDDVLRVVDHLIMKIVDMEADLLAIYERRQYQAKEAKEESEAESDDLPQQHLVTRVSSKMPHNMSRAETANLDEVPGVTKKDLKRYLKKELSEANACLTLPFVIVMFAAFCLGTIGASGHFKTEQLHSQDYAISFDIEENANFAFVGKRPFENGRMGFKGIHDVNSIADFWSWFNMGLLPLFFPTAGSWDTSETRVSVAAMCGSFKSSLEGEALPAAALSKTESTRNMHGSLLKPGGAQQSRCPEGPDAPERPKDVYGEEQVAPYLFFNEIVGGIRMRQEYTPEIPCHSSTEPFKGHLFGGQCLDFGPYDMEPEMLAALNSDKELLDHPNGRTIFIRSKTPWEEVQNITRQLENEVWFSPKTRKLDMLYTTYNAHFNTVTATFLIFVLSRSGHIFKIVEPITFTLDPYPDWTSFLPDVIWFLCVIKMAVGELMDVSQYWDQFGPVTGTAKYMSPLNFVDWMNVVYALIIVILWGLQISSIGILQGVLLVADPTLPGSFGSEDSLATYFDQVESIASNNSLFRRILAFYPFIIVSGFMKPFHGQPRLGIMTKTLAVAAVDIIHFGVVFMLVFVIYSIMGMILFGQELVEFGNFGRAFTNTFRCLLGELVGQETLPDSEYPMARSGRLEAALWLWSFCWVVNLIMLNMLLAIVMDTYASVKADVSTDAETLWSQAGEIAIRFYYQAKYSYVSLEKILEVVDPTALDDGPDKDDEQEVTVESLIEECDTERHVIMPKEQAKYLLVKVKEFADDKGGSSTSETTKMIKIMEEEIRALLHIIEANHVLLHARAYPFQIPEEEVEEVREQQLAV